MQDQAVPVDGDHVEARARTGCDELQVIGSQAPQLCAFSRIDGTECASESWCRSQFYLDENDRLSVLTDEVNLSSGKTNVLLHDRVAALCQELCRFFLAGSPLCAVTRPQYFRIPIRFARRARAKNRCGDARTGHVL